MRDEEPVSDSCGTRAQLMDQKGVGSRELAGEACRGSFLVRGYNNTSGRNMHVSFES